MSVGPVHSKSFPAPLDLLSEQDTATLEQHAIQVQIPAGTCIFQAGEEGDACYLIDEGVVRVDLDQDAFNSQLEIDSDRTLGYVEAGGILGELSLLDRLPRSASAYAQTDVLARRIGAADVERLVRAHPGVGVALYAALGRDAALKLRRTNERLASAVFTGGPDPKVNAMVERAVAAQQEIENWSEERIDRLLAAMAQIIADHADELAQLNVAESGMGDVPSKIMKIRAFSVGAYASLMGVPGRGTRWQDDRNGVTEYASPVGVVLGLGPLTNPVSTFIFKAIICVKGRNALIYSPNRRARRVAIRTEELISDALQQNGAPPNLVQCVRMRTSRQQASEFMSHKHVGLILATAGPSVVRDAYSSGTPAIGTNSGNTPVLVSSDVDVPAVVERIIKSKTFDQGMVCAGEHNLVVVSSIRQAFVQEAERQGVAVLSEEEVRALTNRVVDRWTRHFHADIIGQPAATIAAEAHISRHYPIRLLIVPTDDPTPENPYAHGKLAPLLSLFTAVDEDDGIRLCQAILNVEGKGHTAVIHSESQTLIDRFADAMPASRILVNSPASQGILGLTNGLALSLTLGCGTDGSTSTTDNVTLQHVLNVKRLAKDDPAATAFWSDIMEGLPMDATSTNLPNR